MGVPGWHEQNPRIESRWEAHLREQTEALTRRCEVCQAAPKELCINAQTGKPFRGNVSHLPRVKAST